MTHDTGTQEPKPLVHLYADGACSGNPGPGGWGYVLEHPLTGKSIEASGGEPETTNNRMEIRAVIEGLHRLRQPSRVVVTTDSRYIVDGMSSWMAGWIRNGWRTAEKKPVKNQDLWRELRELSEKHELSFDWVRGHTGHPQNERCDRLATEAIKALAGGSRGAGGPRGTGGEN